MKTEKMKMNDREAEQARLMFIFSCFTGMSIADMETLQYGHIQMAADGQKYIRKERQKTKVGFVVPLHPIAEAIINHCRKKQENKEEWQAVKEKGDSLVFHSDCSRSVMGKNLCIVGKACGIRQSLSYHMARHTFGTMSLSAGIPIESIAMTESELTRFFGVTWRKLNHRLQTIMKSSDLHPDERSAGEEAFFISGCVQGYAPLYPLPMIITLSFLLDSTEAHLFRNYVCQRLQKPTAVITPIFLLDTINN